MPVVSGEVEANLESVAGVVEDVLADLSTARFGKIDPPCDSDGVEQR